MIDTTLLPLGINGFYPSYGRHTSSYLLLIDAHLLLLDAGTGVHRLQESPARELIQSYDVLHLVLSHYHWDHVEGVFALLGIWEKPIRVYAPARPFVDTEPEEAIRRCVGPPLTARALDHYMDRIAFTPVNCPELNIGSLPVQCWSQSHPGGSVGYRIGDRLVYMTDKAVAPGDAERAHAAPLLMHELWMTDREAEDDPEALTVHSRVRDVAELARQARVGCVMPVHHQPTRPADGVEALCRELENAGGVPVVCPQEGRRYALDALPG